LLTTLRSEMIGRRPASSIVVYTTNTVAIVVRNEATTTWTTTVAFITQSLQSHRNERARNPDDDTAFF
jgi:hypothetical protein